MTSTKVEPFEAEEAAADCAATHDRLSIEHIRHALWTDTLGQHICLYGNVPSTNKILATLARAGAPEGTVLLAEEQSRGRARSGKSWFSPSGRNLYISVLFRPSIAVNEVPAFSLIASLALSEAIRAEGVPAAIKWPNDVLVAGKKVAGTLVECGDSGGRASFVVLGVGVNINVDDELLEAALWDEADRATSLREAAGRVVDRNQFTASFLNRLERWFDIYRHQGRDAVLAAWRERDALAGRRVEILANGQPWQGRALGVDRDGYLEVEANDGSRTRVIAGEIRILAQ